MFLLFQHFVLVLTTFLAYAIPDIPNNLKTQQLREEQLQKELQFQFDKLQEQEQVKWISVYI